MKYELEITSAQNPKIKRLLLLQQKSSERKKSGLFVLEGQREMEHAISKGYKLETIFFCPELMSSEADALVQAAHEQIAVNTKIYEKIAYRGTTEGVIGLFHSQEHSLDKLRLKENPLIVVLERVEKPGNLGAILRSCDAAGADALIVCDPLTDIYNPNLIRSSIGAIFTVPTAICSSEECIAFLKERGIQILTAQLQDSHLYYNTPMTQGTAIIMGTEATGLTPQWRKAADAHIRIPMLGQLDSLNVSVSAAILLFEAVRQRSSSEE